MAGARRQRRRGRRRVGGGGDNSQPRKPNSPSRARPIREELCELSPFSVFCALHLGIAPDDRYAPSHVSDVQRHFDLSDSAFKEYLEEHQLSEAHLRHAKFDIEAARFDIEVAPEGVSPLELARSLYEEFRAARV